MKKIPGVLGIIMGVFLFAGVASASDVDILQPASTITYNEDLTVNGVGRFTSLHIGGPHIGGVLYTNGTIINDGPDIPVTIGDNLRVDGQIWGGPHKGNSKDQGLKIADTVLPGVTNINDLGSSNLKWRDLHLSGSLQGVNATLTGNVDFTTATVLGLSTDADTLDGKDASDFALNSHNHDLVYSPIGHNHDADYLKLSGGTLTDDLIITGSTNFLHVDGFASIDNVATFGGGYGNTGVAIMDTGDINMNGNLNVDGVIDLEGNIDVGGNINMTTADATVDGIDISTIPTSYLALGGGTLTGNLTVNGVTGLTDTDIPNNITASNYLSISSGGTISGNVQLYGSNNSFGNAAGDIFWANGRLIIKPYATEPFNCAVAGEEGALWYDDTTNKLKVCVNPGSGGWEALN